MSSARRSALSKFSLFNLSVRWYLVLALVIGAAARWIGIAESSIWHDEGYTMMLAPMSPGQIIARTARDVHPPLYYLALHYWLLLFGSSEAAARSLSGLALLAGVPLAYLLVRRLWDERAARLAGLALALGPFLIRYSQEARMYGLVGFLLLLATYLLVRALDNDRNGWWWTGYTLAMAGAFYTHYYSVFMVLVHWIYVAVRSNRTKRQGLWNWRWWVANVGIVALFVPWLPTAYAQFTRVQGSFWIPKATLATLPATLIEFVVYGLSNQLTEKTQILAGLAGLLVLAWLFWRHRDKRRSLVLLAAYCLVGPALVWLISFGKRPIFVDRYFVFASVAFYALVGVALAELRRWWLAAGCIVVTGLFIVGIINIHKTTDHQMRVIGAYVNQNFQPGDEILSGELYTFFDFSYYNHTGAQTHLWSKQGVNGYGESSLIYDRADQIVVEQLNAIHPASHHLWMVGKTGAHDYYDPTILPKNWVPIGPHVTAGYCAVQEYLVR